MAAHRRGKNHKRRYHTSNPQRNSTSMTDIDGRARMLNEEPYSQKEADAAAGLGTATFYEALESRKEAERLAKESVKPMEVE